MSPRTPSGRRLMRSRCSSSSSSSSSSSPLLLLAPEIIAMAEWRRGGRAGIWEGEPPAESELWAAACGLPLAGRTTPTVTVDDIFFF